MRLTNGNTFIFAGIPFRFNLKIDGKKERKMGADDIEDEAGSDTPETLRNERNKRYARAYKRLKATFSENMEIVQPSEQLLAKEEGGKDQSRRRQKAKRVKRR